MSVEILKTLYQRELSKLKAEIAAYRDEKLLWRTEKNVPNSAGNLCLHLIGNLNAYIGVGLAGTDYVRARELEFSLSGISKDELLEKIGETLAVVEKGLSALSPDRLSEDFPVMIWEKPTGMEYTLVHLLTHLSYHLGQINYHRRFFDAAG